MMPYIFIALTILSTAYGQLVIKWQAMKVARMHQGEPALQYVVHMFLNPWVISGILAAFGASICWMLAVAKLELTRAYPFMALNFVLVGLAAWPLFGEPYNLNKTIGLLLIVAGLIFSSQG